jgi:hypothetical protein
MRKAAADNISISHVFVPFFRYVEMRTEVPNIFCSTIPNRNLKKLLFRSFLTIFLHYFFGPVAYAPTCGNKTFVIPEFQLDISTPSKRSAHDVWKRKKTPEGKTYSRRTSFGRKISFSSITSNTLKKRVTIPIGTRQIRNSINHILNT